MTTAADRRRRPFALLLAVAVLAVALGLLLRPSPARAACPLDDPLCDTTTTSTTFERSTTSSLFDATPTTSDTIRESTTTVRRRSTATSEDITTTTVRSVTVSTARDLLIPGDGTKGAESTTTTLEKIATAKSGLSDDQLILLIVGGLAVVSLVLGLLMWRYWSATRPAGDEPRPAAHGRG